MERERDRERERETEREREREGGTDGRTDRQTDRLYCFFRKNTLSLCYKHAVFINSGRFYFGDTI